MGCRVENIEEIERLVLYGRSLGLSLSPDDASQLFCIAKKVSAALGGHFSPDEIILQATRFKERRLKGDE